MIEIRSGGSAYVDANEVWHGSRTYRVESTDDETAAYVREVCERQLFREFPTARLVVKKPNPAIKIAPGIYHIEVAFEFLPNEPQADSPTIREAASCPPK